MRCSTDTSGVKPKTVKKEVSHAEQRDKKLKCKLFAKLGIEMADSDEDEADVELC